VPRSLSAIVSRCLERDPNARYQSAQELTRALEGWGPSSASPTVIKPAPASGPRSVQISFNMPGRRGWLWAAAVALIVAALISVPAIRGRITHSASPTANSPASAIPALSQGKYLAVFPLGVTGDEKSLRYVADGLVDALS